MHDPKGPTGYSGPDLPSLEGQLATSSGTVGDRASLRRRSVPPPPSARVSDPPEPCVSEGSHGAPTTPDWEGAQESVFLDALADHLDELAAARCTSNRRKKLIRSLHVDAGRVLFIGRPPLGPSARQGWYAALKAADTADTDTLRKLAGLARRAAMRVRHPPATTDLQQQVMEQIWWQDLQCLLSGYLAHPAGSLPRYVLLEALELHADRLGPDFALLTQAHYEALQQQLRDADLLDVSSLRALELAAINFGVRSRDDPGSSQADHQALLAEDTQPSSQPPTQLADGQDPEGLSDTEGGLAPPPPGTPERRDVSGAPPAWTSAGVLGGN